MDKIVDHINVNRDRYVDELKKTSSERLASADVATPQAETPSADA